MSTRYVTLKKFIIIWKTLAWVVAEGLQFYQVYKFHKYFLGSFPKL